MRKWIIPITFVCIISGILLALQFKLQASQPPSPIEERNEILVGIINNLEEEISNYQEKIAEIKSEMEAIEDATASYQTDIKYLQQKVQKAKFQAGLTAVKGRGILITLDDNKNGLALAPNDDPNRFIIHYENILNLITELKLLDAEAISVNDQRIVTNSEIRCVGNVILVNTTRLAPPFEIKAIGNPERLEEILLTGEYDLLKSTGFPVSYEIFTGENHLEIPAYTGAFQFNYTTLN